VTIFFSKYSGFYMALVVAPNINIYQRSRENLGGKSRLPQRGWHDRVWFANVRDIFPDFNIGRDRGKS
jgi:hypothetical protein